MSKIDKLALDSLGSVLSLQLLAIESSLKAYDQLTQAEKKDEIEALISKFNLSIRNLVNKMNKTSNKPSQSFGRQSLSPRLRNSVKKNSFTLNTSQCFSNQDFVKEFEDKQTKDLSLFRLRRFFHRWKLSTISYSKQSYDMDELNNYINKFRVQEEEYLDDFSSDRNRDDHGLGSNNNRSLSNSFSPNNFSQAHFSPTYNEESYDMNYEEYIKEFGDMEEVEVENLPYYKDSAEQEEIFFASDGTPINESNYLDFPTESYFEANDANNIDPILDIELSQPYNDDFFHNEDLTTNLPNISSFYNVSSKSFPLDLEAPLNASSFLNSISPPVSSSSIRPSLSSSQTLPIRTPRRKKDHEDILLESLEQEILPMYQKYLPM